MCRIHVKALVDSIGDVVVGNFSSSVHGFHVLRVHVGDKCERFLCEVRSRLRNDFNLRVVGEVFLQALINYFRNARLR